jgi:hypothetical protein
MTDAVLQKLAELKQAAAPRRCLLCGAVEVYLGGLWAPKDQARFGAPPGKVRAIHFYVCKKCAGLCPRKLMRRVEKILFAEAALPGQN